MFSKEEIQKWLRMTGILAAVLTLIVLLLFAVLWKPEEKNSGLLSDLRSGKGPLDPTPVTKEDLAEEYESRDEITLDLQNSIQSVIEKHLTLGKFSALDSFLAQQQKQYKNSTDEREQTLENWDKKFAYLRADLTATINLPQDDTPSETLKYYSDPQVLAAAIAYSPISCKMYAFTDWSAVILPAVPEGKDIHLLLVELKNAGQRMQELSTASQTKYIDLLVYDMTLFGYQFQLTLVADEHGYYRPYTLENTDGLFPNGPTKTELEELEAYLDPYSDLDSVYSVPEYSPEFSESITHHD